MCGLEESWDGSEASSRGGVARRAALLLLLLLRLLLVSSRRERGGDGSRRLGEAISPHGVSRARVLTEAMCAATHHLATWPAVDRAEVRHEGGWWLSHVFVHRLPPLTRRQQRDRATLAQVAAAGGGDGNETADMGEKPGWEAATLLWW